MKNDEPWYADLVYYVVIMATIIILLHTGGCASIDPPSCSVNNHAIGEC